MPALSFRCLNWLVQTRRVYKLGMLMLAQVTQEDDPVSAAGPSGRGLGLSPAAAAPASSSPFGPLDGDLSHTGTMARSSYMGLRSSCLQLVDTRCKVIAGSFPLKDTPRPLVFCAWGAVHALTGKLAGWLSTVLHPCMQCASPNCMCVSMYARACMSVGLACGVPSVPFLAVHTPPCWAICPHARLYDQHTLLLSISASCPSARIKAVGGRTLHSLQVHANAHYI